MAGGKVWACGGAWENGGWEGMPGTGDAVRTMKLFDFEMNGDRFLMGSSSSSMLMIGNQGLRFRRNPVRFREILMF
uniref:Uncharacterized protein n=1 Tax=Oryza sativa subsp. japonica TaxID=39947 RepID=Q67WN3_ORYSJ|nr:hypothetical protein [Oryza sativa Japonica Group]